MDYSGSTNVAELHFLLLKAYMIRRLKKDVLDELPDKRRQQIEVSTDPKVVKQINKMLEKMRDGGLDYSNEDPEQVMKRLMGFRNNPDGNSLFESYTKSLQDGEKEAEGMGAFMQAYRLTGESKVDGVCEFMETLVDAGAKFLVFAHH